MVEGLLFSPPHPGHFPVVIEVLEEPPRPVTPLGVHFPVKFLEPLRRDGPTIIDEFEGEIVGLAERFGAVLVPPPPGHAPRRLEVVWVIVGVHYPKGPPEHVSFD